MSRRAIDLYRTSWWCSFGYLVPSARVEHDSSSDMLK